MAGPIRISILADSRGAVAGINQTAKAAESLGDRMRRKIGPSIAIGFAAAGAAAVKLGTDAVQAASAAEQSMGATEAIFGRYADKVVKHSERAANAVGLSANEYRESSNLLGALFKNQGVELSKLSTKTEDHVKLAADLAAMYGGTVTDSVEALTAAYKGEFNQLEKYGISLKQETINTEASAVAKKRFGKELKALTPAQQSLAKQLATQNLLFRQSADAAGAFGRESNTLAGKQQRLAARVENLKAKIGAALLPVMIDLAEFASRRVVPVLEKFSKYLTENRDDIRAAAREWGGRLLSALEDVWRITKPLLEALNAIPGPMKEIALQAGLMAAAMKKIGAFSLVSSLSTLGTSLDDTSRKAEKATGSLSRFGGMARNVAGVGGMVALSQAGSQTNDTMSGLLDVMGGAGVGFMVAGPWGALAGAVAGAGKALWDTEKAMSAARDRARELNEQIKGGTAKRLQQEAEDYLRWALTLNNAGKLTEDTIKRIRKIITAEGDDANLLTSLASEMEVLGLKAGTVTKAMSGNKGALREVATAMAEASNGSVSFDQAMEALRTNSELSVDAYAKINTEVLSFALGWSKVRGEMTTAQQNIANVNRETKSLRESVREPIRTMFRTNAPDTTIEIAKVAKQYKLTPPEIKTIIKLSGVDTSKSHIQALIRQMDGLPPEAKKRGDKAGRDLNAGTGEGVKNSKNLWLDPYKRALTDGGGAKQYALDGGTSVGSNLGMGMYNGLGQWIDPLRTRAASMVNAAVAEARAAGEIHSPSRKTDYIGQMLGVGMAGGMDKTVGRVARAAKGLTLAALAGVTSGSSGIDDALSKITDQIKKSVKGKNEEKREKRILKALKDQFAALRANGRAQDQINEGLEKARALLEQATNAYNDYAKAARDVVVATGDITKLGRLDDGTVSITSLIEGLENAANDAERFEFLIKDLSSRGLSKEQIDQMLAAGPEAALATAEAIAAGGDESIKRITELQSRLTGAGDRLGQAMASKYYQVGVDAAAGLVAGLESQLAAVQAAAEAMAAALTKATKKKLKSKSPSKVFEAIADDVTDGLTLRLDKNNTYVKRQGAALAGSLQAGFGRPALAAYASSRAGGFGPAVQITVEVPPTANKAEIGREIQSTLDAYYAVGGRSAA